MSKTQPYESASKLSRKEIIWNNFFGGIAWAFGATIGLSLVLTLLGLLAKDINLIPVVGSFVSDILNFVLSHNHNIQH